MNKEDREILDLKFSGLKAEIMANHDLQMVKLETIYKQALKTNGRVTELEKETRIIRIFERKPILLVLVCLGLLVLYGLFDLTELIKLLK